MGRDKQHDRRANLTHSIPFLVSQLSFFLVFAAIDIALSLEK
jgi:hypothetical protein